MALLADGSGDANSNLVQGNGTNSLTFTMPKNVALNVSSVLATINNAAGGDTTATMVIKDQSGEVIATKRQLEVIPAGDTGTANWSLRDDDNGGTGTAAGFIRFAFDNVGEYLTIRTTGHVAPAVFNGIVLNASETIVIESDSDIDIECDGQMNLSSGADTHVDVFGELVVNSANNATISASNGDLTLGAENVEADFSSSCVLQGSGAGTSLSMFASNSTGFRAEEASGAQVFLGAGEECVVVNRTGQTLFRVAEDGTVTVRNPIAGEIFRVDPNGDLHGETGKALVFDL